MGSRIENGGVELIHAYMYIYVYIYIRKEGIGVQGDLGKCANDWGEDAIRTSSCGSSAADLEPLFKDAAATMLCFWLVQLGAARKKK